MVDDDINHHSDEIIKGTFPLLLLTHFFPSNSSDLEKKLDIERSALKKSHDELTEAQQKVRLLEIGLNELTSSSNKLKHDYQQVKRSNEKIVEQMELENQRRAQYEKELKELKLLPRQLSTSVQKEKQMQEQFQHIQNENQRLTKESHQMNNEYETIKTKIADYEEQLEG